MAHKTYPRRNNQHRSIKVGWGQDFIHRDIRYQVFCINVGSNLQKIRMVKLKRQEILK